VAAAGAICNNWFASAHSSWLDTAQPRSITFDSDQEKERKVAMDLTLNKREEEACKRWCKGDKTGFLQSSLLD